MGSAVTAAVRGSSSRSVRTSFVDVGDAVLALRAPLARAPFVRVVGRVLISLARARRHCQPIAQTVIEPTVRSTTPRALRA